MKELSIILSEVMMIMLKSYSKETVEKAIPFLTPKKNLLKLKNILESNPTEEEFIQLIAKMQ